MILGIVVYRDILTDERRLPTRFSHRGGCQRRVIAMLLLAAMPWGETLVLPSATANEDAVRILPKASHAIPQPLSAFKQPIDR